jgi:hypothetical protein
VDAHAARARIDHTAQPVGTAILEHAVTAAAAPRPAGGGQQFLDDSINDTLKFVSSHVS